MAARNPGGEKCAILVPGFRAANVFLAVFVSRHAKRTKRQQDYFSHTCVISVQLAMSKNAGEQGVLITIDIIYLEYAQFGTLAILQFTWKLR